MEQEFKNERVLIGQGKMAKVYLWNGFAYKCFRADYPIDWISYEMHIQNIVNQTGLPTVKYYPSEFPNSIKMDYINGITLADKIRKEKYNGGLDDLLSFFLKIHEKNNIDLPRLNPFLLTEIGKLDIDNTQKELAFRYISEISDENTLCHLDYHFLNLMYTDNGYYIIDWVNAKIGNPIYDIARTYVIMYEFANRFSKKFLKMVQELGKYESTDLQKAIYVMALHRLSEYESEKTKRLINETETILLS